MIQKNFNGCEYQIPDEEWARVEDLLHQIELEFERVNGGANYIAASLGMFWVDRIKELEKYKI